MWFVKDKSLLSWEKGVTYFLSNHWELTVYEEFLLTIHQCKVSANSSVLALQNEWTLNRWVIVFTRVWLWWDWKHGHMLRFVERVDSSIHTKKPSTWEQENTGLLLPCYFSCELRLGCYNSMQSSFYKHWMLEDEDKGEQPRPVGRKQ